MVNAARDPVATSSIHYPLTRRSYGCLPSPSRVKEPLRILDEDGVYLLVGYAGLLEDGEDVLEEVGYMPVGQELFGFLREYGGTAEPDVHRVVREHDTVSVARPEEPEEAGRAHLIHRHTDEALDAVAVKGDVDPVVANLA